jgi:hypothetical protein
MGGYRTGILPYWENALSTRPRLAQMAFDFLSAPGILISPRFILVDRNLGTASSVDAERAFSGGRLQVNHLQHQTSSQALKAPVALGSWIRTPLLPSSVIMV